MPSSLSFSKYMQALRTAEVVATDTSGFTFTLPGAATPLLVITPCLNIRIRNFIMLLHDSETQSLEVSSVYIAEDCQDIFDKQNRGEFFAEIRRKITEAYPAVSLLTYSTNGLNLDTPGNRTLISAGRSVILEVEPIEDGISEAVADASTQVIVRYRSIDYRVTSRFFADITEANRRLFTYQLIGNVYAKNKKESR